MLTKWFEKRRGVQTRGHCFDKYREKSIITLTKPCWSQDACVPFEKYSKAELSLYHQTGRHSTLADNKADLSRFLSGEMIMMAPQDKVIIVSGRFQEEEEVRCSDRTVDDDEPKCNYELVKIFQNEQKHLSVDSTRRT